jgi:hypothetical protein
MDLLIVVIFAAIALLGLAASQWGVDSRPSFADRRHPETSIGLF